MKLNRVFKFAFLFLAVSLIMVFLMDSCSDIFKPEGRDSINSTMGLVKISLGADNISSSPRTMTPITSNPGKYKLKFTNTAAPPHPSAGVIVTGELAISGNNTSATFATYLVPGNWTVDVERYETRLSQDYLVARGSAAITGLAPGATTSVPVNMLPIDGDTGFLSYTINLPSGMAGTKADLRIVRISDGAQYGFSDRALPADGTAPANQIKLPPGDYDVFVSLTAPDGRGTGKYSAARIYSGMVTSTGTEFSGFTADHFVKSLNLAGTVNFDALSAILPNPSAANNMTITAYDALTDVQVGTTSQIKWTASPQVEWKISNIAPSQRTVYFKVVINGANGETYTTTKPLVSAVGLSPSVILSNIPDKGMEGISLSAGIYSVNTTGTWPSGDGAISAGVNGTPRATASPGEVVTLNISSNYGLKAGSLRADKGPESLIVSMVDNKTYTFVMQDGPVNVDAVFFTAKLNALSLNSVSGNVSLDSPFSPDTPSYAASVPYDITGITVFGTAAENEMSVTIDNPPTFGVGQNTYNVRVTPPGSSGATYPYRTYTVIVTRRGDDLLTALSLSPGVLTPGFGSLTSLYTATVSAASVDITLSASSGALVSITDISGTTNYTSSPYSSSITTGFNTIYIDVTPQYGLPTHIRRYTIIIYLPPPPPGEP